jgi:hypothetical protein
MFRKKGFLLLLLLTTYFVDESDKVRNARSLLFGGCGGARDNGGVTHVIVAAVLVAGDGGQPAVDGARAVLRNAQNMVVIWPKDYLLLFFAVLRIHDMLLWIWIRIWIRGSMPLSD